MKTAESLQRLHQARAPDGHSQILDDATQMHGREVCVGFGRNDRQPYIIILTIKGEKVDIITGLEAGANDYLAKPFDPGELHARVEVGRRMVEMQDTLASKIGELRRALDQIKTLRGIIPICASCKKIRDDNGYWKQVEVYIRDHSEAEFSHGICPECVKELYPKYMRKQTDVET